MNENKIKRIKNKENSIIKRIIRKKKKYKLMKEI